MPQWIGSKKSDAKTPPSPSAPLSPANAASPPTRSSPSLRSISRRGFNGSSASINSKEQKQDEQTLNDIINVRCALDCFLDSRISEAETILQPHKDTSMYYSLGYSFIMFLKCVMTFEHSDVEKTIESLKHTIHLANQQRKRDSGWFDNITSWMKGNTLQSLKTMSWTHRHAELVYAEAYLLKALLSIVHDESIVSFLREGLNIRSSYNTYRHLERFVDYVKEEAAAGRDVSAYQLDDHFTSGVALGIGCFNIILSLLPSTVVKVAEFVGFSADRKHGLSVLESIGGWDEDKAAGKDAPLPEPQAPDEGLRRQLCDMVLIMYHVVLSKLVPLSGVNELFAQRILAYNLNLYPNGVFFLYFYGRLLVSQGKIDDAKVQYHRAIATQQDWKQLQHLCYWELGIINLMQKNWETCYEIYTQLANESNWSKAVYTYLRAISRFSVDPKDKEAVALMEQVNSAKKKIAGKSIPMEKFVSRKARKFLAQGGTLFLPDLEMLNAFSAYDFMPICELRSDMDRLNKAIEALDEKSNSHHVDDLCLGLYLRALTARVLVQKDSGEEEILRDLHKTSLDTVFENASKIELDHYIYYFSLYERARMMMLNKDYTGAKAQVQIILRAAEKGHYNVGAGPHAKNKYSLENALVFKCHNCLATIDALKSIPSDKDNNAVKTES